MTSTVRLQLFATARAAAGLPSDQFLADTFAELLDQARSRYGEGFERVITTALIWVNGEPTRDPGVVLQPCDEVAIIPPISGG